jgi:hypothetical protein
VDIPARTPARFGNGRMVIPKPFEAALVRF